MSSRTGGAGTPAPVLDKIYALPVLQNLPPRPRGETSIEVTFSLDAGGVLQVRARDAQTGTEQRATLTLVGDVAQEEVAASRERLQQLRR